MVKSLPFASIKREEGGKLLMTIVFALGRLVLTLNLSFVKAEELNKKVVESIKIQQL